jgi:proteasome lid subunit RPN8/RPN11
VNTSARLLITEMARAALTAAAARAHPCETGGILIGVYADGHPWVTTAVEIDSPDSGRSHYRIPAGTTHNAVRAARARDDRLGYLGDWHTHPCDVGPSGTDLTTLGLISMRHPLRPNPTQIIVRRTNDGYVLDARRFIMFAARECSIGLTGDLPHLRATNVRDEDNHGNADNR